MKEKQIAVIPQISTTATQRHLLGVHTYGAGILITGVLAPRVWLGFGGEVERRQRLEFMAIDHHVPLALLVIIYPTNGPSHRKPIRVLIFLGSISNAHMIASWAYHQQY